MKFDLFEKKIDKIDMITAIDILAEDAEDIDKIMIRSPTYREINGFYTVWKYSNYGYVWKKQNSTNHQDSRKYILFYQNNLNETGSRKILKSSDKMLSIYKQDTQLNGEGLILCARCYMYKKDFEIRNEWMVFDEQLCKMVKINNIEITKKI